MRQYHKPIILGITIIFVLIFSFAFAQEPIIVDEDNSIPTPPIISLPIPDESTTTAQKVNPCDINESSEECQQSREICNFHGTFDDLVGQCNCDENFQGEKCDISVQQPDSTQDTNDSTYSWNTGAYTPCRLEEFGNENGHFVQECGTLWKSRDIWCAAENGDRVDDSYCNHENKPTDTIMCESTVNCAPNYRCVDGWRCEEIDITNNNVNFDKSTQLSSTPRCPVGYYGEKCTCREIYMTLPFSNPPDHTFDNHTSGVFNPNFIHPTQKKYVNKLTEVFGQITDLPASLFVPINWSSSKFGDIVKITFAVRQPCTMKQLLMPNPFFKPRHNGTSSYDDDEEDDSSTTDNNNDKPWYAKSPTEYFRTLQITPPMTNTVAANNNNNNMMMNNTEISNTDVQDLYKYVDMIVNELNNPESSYQGLIPRKSPLQEKSGGDVAFAEASSILATQIASQEAIYDPTCTGNSCPVGDSPKFTIPGQYGKLKDIHYQWIILGVVIGVIILGLIIAMCCCCTKCCGRKERKEQRHEHLELGEMNV